MPTLQDIKRIGEFKCNIAHLNAMTKEVNREPHKVYDIIEKYGSYADSYTRETIFKYIADKYYAGDYDVIYKQWLQDPPTKEVTVSEMFKDMGIEVVKIK